MLAPDAFVHPGAAALVGARVSIQIEAADRPPRGALDLEEAYVRMPHRSAAALADVHVEEPLGDFEKPGEHARQGEVGAQLLLGNRIALALQPLREETDIPGLELAPGESLQILELLDGRGPCGS